MSECDIKNNWQSAGKCPSVSLEILSSVAKKDGLKTIQNRICGFGLQRSIKWFDLFGCSRYKTHQNTFLSLSGLKCLSNRRHTEVFSAQCVTLKLNWTDEELTHQDVGAVQRVEVGERSLDRWCCFKSRGAFFSWTRGRREGNSHQPLRQPPHIHQDTDTLCSPTANWPSSSFIHQNRTIESGASQSSDWYSGFISNDFQF